jgi:hypothetical protein
MAAVMRAKLGDGEGIRGLMSESLSNDMLMVKCKAYRRAVLMLLHGAGR